MEGNKSSLNIPKSKFKITGYGMYLPPLVESAEELATKINKNVGFKYHTFQYNAQMCVCVCVFSSFIFVLCSKFINKCVCGATLPYHRDHHINN